MKAESAIFTGIQRPMTYFGLSLHLFILNASASALTFGVFVTAGLMSVALIASVIMFAMAWVVLYRKMQQDLHFSSFLFIAPRFWKSKKSRTLISGLPLTPFKGGNR